MLKEQYTYEGIIESIRFHNQDNYYTVFDLSIETEDIEDIVCVGNILSPMEGENILVTGSFINHPTYGRQLNIISFEKKYHHPKKE